MKKRVGIALAVLLGLVLAGLLVYSRVRSPEPVYNGKTVRVWIREMAQSQAPPRIIPPGPTPMPTPMDALKILGPKAVPYLIEGLQKRDSLFSTWYRRCYQRLRRVLPRSVASLLPPPSTPPYLVQWTSATALGELGPAARPAIPALIDLTVHRDLRVQESAARVLENLCLRDATIRAAFSELLDTKLQASKMPNGQAVKLIASLHGRSPAAITALGMALKDSDPSVRRQAASLLGIAKQDAAAAVPMLVLSLQDDDKQARYAAIQALGNIGPKASAAIPALAQGMLSKDQETRYLTINAIGDIGLAYPTALPTLQAALKDESQMVRSAAARALTKLP